MKVLLSLLFLGDLSMCGKVQLVLAVKMSSHVNIFGVFISFAIIITVGAAAADNSSMEPKLAVDPYTLDVSDLDQTSYENFIERLRGAVTNNKDPPVLPLDPSPPKWFGLKLTARAETSAKETTVRIQKENLYVVGYQAQTGKLFELVKTTDNKQWKESVALGYRGDYGDLERAAGKSVTQVSLTKIAFKKAVLTLADSVAPKDSSPEKNKERARALILVVQMVSEACRFVDISNHIASNILSYTDSPILQWMFVDLEKNWGRFSKYVLFPGTFQAPTINNVKIESVAELRKFLGVLLNTKKSINQPGKIDDDDDVDDELPNIIDVQAQLQDAEPTVLEA